MSTLEEIREEVSQNNLVTKNDLSQAKIELVEKMNKDKIDLIKWIFGFGLYWFYLY